MIIQITSSTSDLLVGSFQSTIVVLSLILIISSTFVGSTESLLITGGVGLSKGVFS